MSLRKKIIIAGPCAAESAKQVEATLREVSRRHIDFVRLSLWKPRTQPGFEGLGEAGIPFLVAAAKSGLNPATEVLLPEQAKKVIYAVLGRVDSAKLLLWIGSRNQNHYLQREIGRVASIDQRVILLVKNQPWSSFDHWKGIIDHVMDSGINKENVLLCHRGFTPNGHNPQGFRNVPDFEMSMKIKRISGLPMLIDPSHTGGSRRNVVNIVRKANEFNFDGLVVEVHPDPLSALTDSKQQLNWEQFDNLIRRI